MKNNSIKFHKKGDLPESELKLLNSGSSFIESHRENFSKLSISDNSLPFSDQQFNSFEPVAAEVDNFSPPEQSTIFDQSDPFIHTGCFQINDEETDQEKQLREKLKLITIGYIPFQDLAK